MGLRDQLPEHSLFRSAALHLGPGAVMVVFYVVTAPWFMSLGFPPLFASLVTIPVILVPWMLGYLAWEGKRRTGQFKILAAVFYRERLAPRHYVIFGAPVILWSALVFMVSEQLVAPVLIDRFLSWLPAWFLNPAEFDHIVAMPTGPLLIFLGSLLVFAGVLAPVVEELYFRGHLLPAVERFGFWAPVITVALFTVYHFESPWENPGRFLVVLPMTFVVWHTRSVAFGVAAHVVLNTLSALALILAVFSARAS